MAYNTYRIESIADVVEIGTKLPYYWFRGHTCTCNELTPKVFRRSAFPHYTDETEAELNALFRFIAPSVSLSCPDSSDHLSWLFLMQHPGLPTRLLDWSQSVLAALFFAVGESPKENGELWALDPLSLNKTVHDRATIFGGDGPPQVSNLAKQAVTARDRWAQEKCEDGDCWEHPVAVFPTLRFARLTNQLSVLTLHPTPRIGETILEILDHPSVVRYVIPKEKKPDLQSALASLGVTYRTMFPDLDGVAKSLVYEFERRRYAKNSPPPEFNIR